MATLDIHDAVLPAVCDNDIRHPRAGRGKPTATVFPDWQQYYNGGCIKTSNTLDLISL